MLIGETHQGIFDLSFFKLIPNITIMAPKDFKELEQMIEFSIKQKGPIVIRYPRGGENKEKFEKCSNIEMKKSEILTNGDDVTIIAIGNQVSKAMNIYNKLKQKNVKAEVINVRFLKPFDKETILKSIFKTKFVITIEDNTLIGGLGTEIKERIVEEKLENIKIKCFGYPDVFVEHGTPKELEQVYQLDEISIIEYILKNVQK